MQADFTREIDDGDFNRHKDVGQMNECETLAEAFDRCGFKLDDRINRRDLVQIYQAIERDSKAEIKRLTDQRQYDEAKVLNERCKFMRREFEQHLMKSEVRVQDQERRLMRHAQKAVMHNMARFHEEHEAETEKKCAWRTNDLKLTHENQAYNLNLEIGHIRRPHMKYSKGLLDLINAEESLVRLKQYDDAKNVRRMIDRILPGEEAAFNKRHEDKLDLMRRRQADEHAEDLKRLNERVSALRWNGVRSREKDMSITEQRLKGHETDMHHSHKLVMMKQPELAVHPSATWQVRSGFVATSAYHRGGQLLNAVNGKQANQAVYVASLCNVHDFEAPQSGTYDL